MAKAVERALAERRHLIVEAGTGTGKTLAYLLPALRTRSASQRVIISTGTKNLQEQLFFKDVPFLESLLGPLRVCYMKGRANYLCRTSSTPCATSPFSPASKRSTSSTRSPTWEQTTETGDRAELDRLPESPPALGTSSTPAPKPASARPAPTTERCFITEMRRKALESDIVIVNHHLFFADLNIKQQAAGAPDAGILPEAAAVIFDEAHELEESPRNYFGIGLSATPASTSSPATPNPCCAQTGHAACPSATANSRARPHVLRRRCP
jgi:ATP-dependent DNA helicase DinG